MEGKGKLWGPALLLAMAVLLVVGGATRLLAQQAAFSVCPPADGWVMAVWQGPDDTPTEEAAATCAEVTVLAVWWLDPATQEWEGFSLDPSVPEAAQGSLRTLDNLQSVFLLGGPPMAPTPTATVTPTPTATPTPTPTPTPTATPLPSYTTHKVSDYISSVGTLHVVGEVRNNTAANSQYVKVSGTFFDAEGKVVASQFTYACLDILPAGGESPFDLLVSEPPPNIARYTLQVEGSPTLEQPATGLEVSGVATRLSPTGAFHVTGLVTNQSDETYRFVQVCGALYDDAGLVVRAGFTFANPDTLAPGQSGSFDFFAHVDSTTIADYRLWTQGKRQ